jgi:hypothetical protein
VFSHRFFFFHRSSFVKGNESFKGKNAGAAKVNMDPSAIAALRKAVDGNQNCCDCDAPSKHTHSYY